MSRTSLLAVSQLLFSLLLLGGVWIALPARWLWVDVPATSLALGCAAAGIGLCLRAHWALWLLRLLLWVELGCGTLIVALLALSVAQLAGSYGPVGAGGAVLMTTIALLITPYMVVFPALLLGWSRKLG